METPASDTVVSLADGFKLVDKHRNDKRLVGGLSNHPALRTEALSQQTSVGLLVDVQLQNVAVDVASTPVDVSFAEACLAASTAVLAVSEMMSRTSETATSSCHASSQKLAVSMDL